MIFHLTTQEKWQAAKSSGQYEAESLSKEGFIHFSTFGQILTVANLSYKNVVNPILLAVDNNKTMDLKWEGEDGLEFPHLYRPIMINEVVRVIALAKNRDDEYIGDTELEESAGAIRLITDRLLLREFQLSDRKEIHSYASDEDLVKYMPWGPNTQIETNIFMSKNFRWQTECPRKNFDFAVINKLTGEFLGSCGVFIKSPDSQVGFIGYILKKSAQGKGYATEFSHALIDFGFNTLNLHRIEATCDEQNAASFRVMQRSGMTREGLLKENMFIKGSRRSTIVCAILKNQVK